MSKYRLEDESAVKKKWLRIENREFPVSSLNSDTIAASKEP